MRETWMAAVDLGPLIKCREGGTRPTAVWGMRRWRATGSLAQGLPTRCAAGIFPPDGGERSQGPTVGMLTHPRGRPELQAVPPQQGFLLPRARTLFRGRASVWSWPP